VPQPLIASPPPPDLTIYFQGLCCFLRDQEKLEDTKEVTTLFVAGERADVGHRLCVHTPVLVFVADDFLRTEGTASHVSALVPGDDRRLPLGVWPLTGKDVRIVGAPARSLAFDPSFGKTADLHRLTQQGAASRECLDPTPPSRRPIGGRIFLTAGQLSASVVAGDSGKPNDRWVFDVEEANPTDGDPVAFSQEIKYEFFAKSPAREIQIEARPWEGEKEVLVLISGAKVAISTLCPIDRTTLDKEVDFLAYYTLLATIPPHAKQLIPHRLNPLVRAGLSACPPGMTFLAARS